MDTQDFLDNVKSWLELYRDVRIPELEYPPAVKDSDIKWEDGMMKVAAAFGICDSLTGTPAAKKVEKAVEMARSKNRSGLKDIYDLMAQVEKYLGDTINK
jgi:hypothetical protein